MPRPTVSNVLHTKGLASQTADERDGSATQMPQTVPSNGNSLHKVGSTPWAGPAIRRRCRTSGSDVSLPGAPFLRILQGRVRGCSFPAHDASDVSPGNANLRIGPALAMIPGSGVIPRSLRRGIPQPTLWSESRIERSENRVQQNASTVTDEFPLTPTDFAA
jgi:hypothetical protein